MARAENETGVALWRRALWFRDGLMIAVLCVCAPRARNVAGTSIGINLHRRGTNWWVCYAARETKNRRPFEAPLPETLNEPIERYIAYYRSALVTRGPEPAAIDMWVSYSGLSLTAKEVGQRITAVTQRELGKAINPHLFRKLIPTELAIQDPEHVGVAQALLGHCRLFDDAAIL
jgi:hypothetical protein